jgi:hypothetical protein
MYKLSSNELQDIFGEDNESFMMDLVAVVVWGAIVLAMLLHRFLKEDEN